MEKLTTPLEALQRVASQASFCASARKKGKPGELIAKQPEEIRALLRNLKSDDISPEVLPSRVAWLGYDADPHRCLRLTSEEKLKFDRDQLKKN